MKKSNLHKRSLNIAGIMVMALGLMLHFPSYAQEFAIDFGKSDSGVQIAKDNFEQLNLNYTFSGIVSFDVETTKGQFSEIAMPGNFFVGKLGTPKLPASKKLIEIPFGADVSIKVNDYNVSEYKLADFGIENAVMPVQPSLRKDMDAADVPFELLAEVYEKDRFVEPEMATIEVLGVMRGYRIARVTIAPVSYNPVKGIVRVYNDIDVEITFDNADQALTQHVKASTWSPYFEAIQNNLINTLGGGGYPSHPDLTKYPVKYLIVADRMFEDDLQPFILWKTMKGFEVITAYTDEIGTSYSAIQTWIHDKYNEATPTDPAPSFFLLVGDTPQIPAEMGSSSGKMTDLYYASVDGDYFPEMYYGRFSATNSAELITQIAKTEFYEKYQFSDPSYLNDVTLIAGADGSWNPAVGQPTVQYGTENYFNASNGFNNVNDYLTSPYTGCYDPDRIAVSLINYTAHCGQTSWGDPQLSQTMVNNFVNSGQYPVAIGNCCLAADFGYGECIGETWQRVANKGSVAYIGSSPSSYWFEDFYWAVGAFPIVGNNSGYVPTVEETTWGAYDAPFVSDYVTTGGTVFVGNLAVTEVEIQGYPSHSSPLYYWQAYNVLGDPSLVPYLTEGSENTVAHMPIVPIGMDFYEVTAEPGSYVGISKDGVLHGSALVGEMGIVEVPMEPVLSSGMVDIVVTKPQFMPYMTQVPAAALEGPYVVLDGYTINDAAGNNDGIADYGETISLNVTLKNVGADPSAAITATVTGSDDFVTLSGSNSQTFPAILPGENATVNNAYTFVIADFVPDQHKAQFTLQVTDGSDTWESNLFITIQAPVIEIASDYLIDDSQTGNGDGILDPGETGLIKLNVSNTGNSAISTIEIAVESDDPLLTINTATIEITEIAAGADEMIEIGVTADGSSPIGYPVNVGMEAMGGPDGLYTASQTVSVVIGLIPEYNMSNETVTTCMAYFFDSGGPGGQYGDNEDLTMTFLPASADGLIQADFSMFDVESNYDYLYIHNGADVSAPQVIGSPFSGSSSPGVVMGMNPEGALTFRFTSDGSVTKDGWEAQITCADLSGVPECATNPNPESGTQNVPITSSLSWSSNDAIEFDVHFGLTPEPPFVETVTGLSFTPEMLPNTTYYWKIVPKNNNGSAEDCPVWQFTTGGPEYLMSTGTVTVTNGMFYDTGGADGSYTSNEDHVMTFEPAVPGQMLKFTFNFFDVESNYDYLHIHNGPDVNAPAFEGSPFHGTTSPGEIVATHESGAITFHFTSDGSVVKAGWAASFETMGELSCTVEAFPGEICQGEVAMLLATASGGTGNYTCSWSPPETLSNPEIMNPMAFPDVTTTYTVTIDDGETTMSDEITVFVLESPQVDLGEDVTICANQTVILDATTPGATSYLWSPSGYTTPTIEVDSTGVGFGAIVYSVVVTNANECEGTDEIEVYFDPCASVTEIGSGLNLLVYPNPASSVLNINLSGNSESVEYSLLNYQGSEVYSRSIGAVNGEINHQLEIGNYAGGIYYLRIKTNNNTVIRKVVIR
jgi:hypothetical protein